MGSRVPAANPHPKSPKLPPPPPQHPISCPASSGSLVLFKSFGFRNKTQVRSILVKDVLSRFASFWPNGHKKTPFLACVQTSPLPQKKSREETSVNHRR